VHLTHEERRLVTSATRAALDAAGYAHLPVLVGCGAQSTRETVMLCADAARSGGSYALVLPPAYNAAMLSRAALLAYFEDVADVSPLPVLVYNYPAVTAGTDLSSADIVRLAAHPNIVGCKLTCGNTGKLGRIAAATRAATAEDAGSGFMCMGGSADFTLPTLAAGGSGIISGLANVTPKACVELYRAGVQGDRERARAAQAVVARGDWAAIQGGIVGCKAALMRYFGYGGFGRRPLPRGGKATAGMGEWDEVVAFEKKL
jgi:dihydrodipicolinate synthase/N-acetylneuraminate lyase